MLCSHPTDTVFSDFFCLVFSSFSIPFPCRAILLILFPVLPSNFHTLPFSLSLLFSACLHYLQPSGSVGKESACNAGDLGLIPVSGRSSGEENGNPLQYSCLDIPWTDELGRLQSMGSQRVRYDCATFTKRSISFQRSWFNSTHVLWTTSASWQDKVELQSCLVSNVCYLTFQLCGFGQITLCIWD